ncbi:MAG: cobyric acid synthase [Chloroflexota bacterium]
MLGRVDKSMAARDYYARKAALWDVVAGALDRLRATHDVIVLEGAGSPAEVNLKATDIVNMRVALYAQAPVLLVGDIDRGGVFAALVGTLELLEPAERALVKGFLINKFRGDRRLLEPGLGFLEERTGVPLLGVIPYIPRLHIAEEDAVALQTRGHNGAAPTGIMEIAVARLPHIANFDDFDLLAADPAVHLRYVERPTEMGAPDLVILPGSKATVADLEFLRASGLAVRIIALARAGTPVLGICGGYQMLGSRLLDPLGVESSNRETPGLGLLAAETTFLPEKRTRRVQARPVAGNGCFGSLAGGSVAGYEIHMGTTTTREAAVFQVAGAGTAEHPDGGASADGLVAGTYLHGLFEEDMAREALVRWLAARRGLSLDRTRDAVPTRETEYNRLARVVREEVDISALHALLEMQG